MTFNQQIKALLDDPSVSVWLKSAVRALIERDPLDAIKDTELLHHLMDLRLNEVFKQAEQELVTNG